MSDVTSTDVAIIGAGTAGLNAFRAAQKAGARALMIDPGPLGTTCARIGCMPSKVLIAAAEAAEAARHAPTFGVHTGAVEIDRVAVMQRVRAMRDFFVKHTRAGTTNKAIDAGLLLDATAHFVDANTLQLDDGRRVQARAFVIATGSWPWVPPPYRELGDRLLTNAQIFELPELPERLLVVGGGAVGLELGQAMHRLGVRVTLLELDDRIANIPDPAVAASAREIFKGEVDAHFHHELKSVRREEDEVIVSFVDDDGAAREERFDYVLSAAGRRPRVDRLQLGNIGLDALGPIEPETGQLTGRNIFVAGDVWGQRMLLHEAGHEGRVAGRNAALYPDHTATRRMVPLGIVFSAPQIALVGEQPVDDEGFAAGEQNFRFQTRARCLDINRGLMRVYADKATRRLVGAALITPHGEHLAHELAWMIQGGLTIDEAVALPFYHPVLEEGLEGALKSLQRALDQG